MITNKKNILFVYLFVGVVSIVAMQKEDKNPDAIKILYLVEKFKYVIRELFCTCINNKNFPPELSEESKNAETIRKILYMCNKDWNKPDLCWAAQKVLDEYSPPNDLLSEHVRSRSIKLISGLKEIFDKHRKSRKNQ